MIVEMVKATDDDEYKKKLVDILREAGKDGMSIGDIYERMPKRPVKISSEKRRITENLSLPEFVKLSKRVYALKSLVVVESEDIPPEPPTPSTSDGSMQSWQ